MYGSFFDFGNGGGGGAVRGGRLYWFVLASLLLHVILLALPASEWRPLSSDNKHPNTSQLQVFLSHVVSPDRPRVLPGPAQIKPGHEENDRRVEDAEEPMPSALPVVFAYEAPEMLTEFPRVLSGNKVSGFLIVRLEIDELGLVRGEDVVYSTMPFEATGKILFLFSQSRFKPARRGGQAVADSILLQVYVD